MGFIIYLILVKVNISMIIQNNFNSHFFYILNVKNQKNFYDIKLHEWTIKTIAQLLNIYNLSARTHFNF